MQDAIELPQDFEGRGKVILEQAAKIAELTDEMDKLRKFVKYLTQGNRSEKRILASPDQRLLPFENDAEFQAARAEAEAEAEVIVQKYSVERHVRKRKPRDESFPSHLPRVEQMAEVPESMKNCPTHGEREIIGYDQTETLVQKPAELYVVVTKYPKFACPGQPECGIDSPERPTSLTEGNRYDTSVAATIIEAKWFHYLPIYRQQDLFGSSGWNPSRSTLLNIVQQSAFVILPFIDFMRGLTQRDIAIGIDDTTCRMLLPKVVPPVVPGDSKSRRLAEKIAEARAKGEDSLLARMWAYAGLHQAPYNIFDFRVSRHRDGPDEFLANSRCTVMADCYSGNTSVVIHSGDRLELAACWAHARRKVEQSQTYQDESQVLLGMIQALYDVETRAKELSWEARQAMRESESTVILTAIKNWIDSAPLAAVLPKSDFAEAIRYIRNHWEALNVYTRDGRLPIDNNAVERLMRQVALGRKAWLFVCSVQAGEQSAMMMSLVSSARRHDLNAWIYIKDVLDQLLAGCTDYHQLLPDVWKTTHPEAVREYREQERRDKSERKQYRAALRRLASPK